MSAHICYTPDASARRKYRRLDFRVGPEGQGGRGGRRPVPGAGWVRGATPRRAAGRSRQWPEVSDFVARFCTTMHVARKRVRLSHGRVFLGSRGVQKKVT